MAASRQVVQVNDQMQLESTINAYIAQGYTVQNRAAGMAVLFKKKEFSVFWAIVGLILCVLPLLIYLIVYALQSDQYLEIRVTSDRSLTTSAPQM